MKPRIMVSLLTSGLFFLSNFINATSEFKYKYQIKGDSFLLKDCIDIYYYKEKLIDTYEKISFSLDSKYLIEGLYNNLYQFKFDEKCYPSLNNGVLVLTLGEGKGTFIEGTLKENVCSTDTIREKIYILDIFK